MQGNLIGSELFWTPVILLNSPYGGQATGSASVSVGGFYAFDSAGLVESSSTSTTTSSQLGPLTNGQAGGLFELDTWSIYYANTVGGGLSNNPCTQSYVAKITHTSGNYHSLQLLPSGSLTDENEPTTMSYNGYTSVVFNNSYTSDQGSVNTCGGFRTTYSVSSQSATNSGVSISFNVGGVVGTTLGSFDIEKTQGSGSSFSYTFPAVLSGDPISGDWLYTSLYSPAQGSGNALAFAYDNCDFFADITQTGSTLYWHVTGFNSGDQWQVSEQTSQKFSDTFGTYTAPSSGTDSRSFNYGGGTPGDQITLTFYDITTQNQVLAFWTVQNPTNSLTISISQSGSTLYWHISGATHSGQFTVQEYTSQGFSDNFGPYTASSTGTDSRSFNYGGGTSGDMVYLIVTDTTTGAEASASYIRQ